MGLASLRRWTGSWSLSSHEALPLSDLAGIQHLFQGQQDQQGCKTWLQNVANMVAMLNFWSNKFPRFSPVLRRLKDCPISIDVVPPKGTNTNTSGLLCVTLSNPVKSKAEYQRPCQDKSTKECKRRYLRHTVGSRLICMMVYSSSGEPLHSYSNGDSKVKVFLCVSMFF